MTQSVYSVGLNVAGSVAPSRDRVREMQSIRGIMIGIGLSAILWAPLGVVAMRLF